jgi:tricorn protease
MYIDVASKKVTEVDQGNMNKIRDYSWSHDSKWLAYSISMDYQNSQIIVYNLAENKTHTLTGTFYNCYNPVF